MIAFTFYFSALGAIICGSAIIPAVVAFGFQEYPTGFRILQYSALGGFFCVATLLAVRGRLDGLGRNTAILLAVTSWMAFPAITALPLTDLLNLSYTDAIFQTMSAFTTSGPLIFGNEQAIPRSMLFLLAQFQWLGGLAVLITLILVLAPWEIGGLPQVGSASVAASIVASQSRLSRFCWRIFRAYLLLTLICFICLLLARIAPYDAMLLSFTALSTGGILPTSESLDLMLGIPGMLIMAVFMIIGATSIFWHEDLLAMDATELKSHRESYFVLAIWIVVGLFVSYSLTRSTGGQMLSGNLNTLSEGLFNAASIVSTTGIQSRPGVFSLLPATLVLLLVFVGSGCYSTAGGLKFFRIGGIFSLSQYELNRLLYPSSVKPTRFGNTEFDIGIMKAIWSLFATLIATVGLFSFILADSGLSFQASFTAIIAAISNAGLVYTPEWVSAGGEAWPLYPDMTDFQKYVITLTMFLGRLEVIAVIACVTVLIRKFR